MQLDPNIGVWMEKGDDVFRATGLVGIGTSTPTALLDIVAPSTAELRLTSHNSIPLFVGRRVSGTPSSPTATLQGDQMAFFCADGHTGTGISGIRAAMIIRANETFTNLANGTTIGFETTQTTDRQERMRITDDGRVGIGTFTPEQGLELVSRSTAQIAATAHNSTALFLGRSANGGLPDADTAIPSGRSIAIFGAQGHDGTGFSNIRAAIVMKSAEIFTPTTTGTSMSFETTLNGTNSRLERVRITNDGNLNMIDRFGITQITLTGDGTAFKPGGGSWSLASDARLKKDVAPLEGALEKLLRLRSVTYEYIDPAATHELPGRQTGFIAQEVERVFPEWVGEKADGYKFIAVKGFESLTVQALRELRAEKDALAAKVAALEAKDKAREARLTRLESALEAGPARAVRASLDLK